MRRGRSAIGTELVPLVLILASLAGSLALVIAIHRRFVARTTAEKLPVAVIAPPSMPPPRPMPIATVPVEPEVADEPEPPPPPPPEDLTPKTLAKLMAAEADQLLEASRADRKAAELETARKAAVLESERLRRRESLVRLQIDSLETKVHKIETSADEMALERDALEKELEARKALVAQARSRPSTAILPHRGQNGTWRRPIVVECVNGMAIIRPQNISFGLLELAMGFGPSTNPFVATIAREAIRIQGSASPDGQLVTPYIFFLVRPDGIRTYYEARGRLEALGITFGYELADQDWEIDFPDLDDVRAWDGSAPVRPSDTVARSRPSGSAPDSGNLPDLGPSANRAGSSGRGDGSGSEFTWPRPKPANDGGRISLGGGGSGTASGGIGGSGASGGGPSGYGTGSGRPSRISNNNPETYTPSGGGSGVKFPGGTAGAVTSSPGTGSGTGVGSGSDDLPPLAPPRELSLGGPISPLPPGTPGSPGNPSPPASQRTFAIDPSFPSSETNPNPNDATLPTNPASLPPVVSPRSSPGDLPDLPPSPPLGSANDPSKAYVLPSPSAPDVNTLNRRAAGSTSPSPDQTPPVRHIGPFSKPLAAGVDPSLLASLPNPPGPPADPLADIDPSQPDSVNSGSVATTSGSTNPATSTRSGNPPRTPNPSQKPGTGTTTSTVIGQGDSSASPDPSGSPPPPLSVGVGMPGPPPPPITMPPLGSPPPPSLNLTPPPGLTPPPSSKPASSPPPSPNFKVIDRKFEVVVVCNPRGVIVQPGGYRVTAEALKDRDGLFKTQVVSLVKAKRMADPKVTIEPNVRFLVQPGGEKTFWTARSQFLLSGLDWPMSTQVADSDHLKIIPSESW